MHLTVAGSFIIAAVCREGIVVAADSRGTMRNPEARPLAFYDQVQKVFPVRNAVLAYTGTDTIQNLYLGAIVRQFTSSRYSDVAIDSLLPAFLRFSDEVLPPVVAERVRDQKLVAAGFNGAEPRICFFNRVQTIGKPFSCGHRYVSSDRCLMDESRGHLLQMTFAETADLADRAIREYAATGGHEDIGGPTVAIALNPAQALWIKPLPSVGQWTYMHEFADDYRAGKVGVTLYPGVTRDHLNSVIEQAAAWSRGAE